MIRDNIKLQKCMARFKKKKESKFTTEDQKHTEHVYIKVLQDMARPSSQLVKTINSTGYD